MAIKTRAQLITDNNTDFPDNVTQLISPEDVRSQMNDTADSALFPEDIEDLDLSDADVTSTGNVTKTLAEWTEDIAANDSGTFTNTGVGAIPRSVTDRLADTVHLLDYVPTSEHAAIYAGTSTTDASDWLESCIASISVDVANAGPEIVLPYGKLRFNRPIELKKTIMLKGHGTGQSGRFATILEFATNQHGIIVHSYNTWDIDKGARAWDSGATYLVGQYIVVGSPRRYYECLVAGGGTSTVAPTHTSGDAATADGYTWRYTDVDPHGAAASVLRDFEIVSLGGTTGHGLWCRARVLCENVRIESFPQNGLHIHATVGPGDITEGNANNCHFSQMRITNSGGNGVHVVGADANAGCFDHIDSSSNAGMGFNDESFLGNCYLAPHTNSNGGRGQVSYDGNRYYLLDNTGLGSTTVPGTDASVWVLVGAGGVHVIYPLWVSGTDYILGHAFRMTSNNVSGGIVLGPYIESGQPASVFIAPWIVVGTGISIAPGSTGFRITGFGQVSPHYVSARSGAPNDYELHFNRVNDEAITLMADGDSANGFQFMAWNSIVNCWMTQWARTTNAVLYTGLASTLTGGRSAPLAGGSVMFPLGFWVGGSSTTARKLTNAAAVPTTGEWAAGDLVLNNAPLAGEPWGWRCVLAGTPGTWQPLRDLGSQQSIATGAAFTLTPGTSPYHTLHNGTMTADRAVTLSTTGALIGLSYKITRTSTGAFNLNVGTGPLKALATNQWCEVTFDGSAWYLSAYGTLTTAAEVDSLDTLTPASGGAVTQLTSKATNVTLDKICGKITTFNDSLAANTSVSFTLLSSKIAAADVVQTSIASGVPDGTYNITVDAVGTGSCRISIHNRTASPRSDSIVINFVVIKGSIS